MKVLLFVSEKLNTPMQEFLRKNGADLTVVRDIPLGKTSHAVRWDEIMCGEWSAKPGEFDWLITCYWPYILPPSMISWAKDSINFHPALLPWGRGWYPHVHAIMQNHKQGVTLHRLAEKVDSGPIWVQEEVLCYPTDCAHHIHERLRNTIFDLFCKMWKPITQYEVVPLVQDEEQAVYFKKKDVEQYNEIFPNELAESAIRKMRARTFWNERYAYYLAPNGQKIFVSAGFYMEENR